MKRPAVFFDRDNTLIANDGFVGTPDKVVLVAGAAEAVARVRAMGFAAVTISNQSGVARGMFTEEAVYAVNARMDELLQDQSPRAIIDRHEFCPFHPKAAVPKYQQESELRKPRPGMILQAADRLGLDLSRSWVIGDAPRDIEAGRAAGCQTILFSDPALKPSEAAMERPAEPPDFVVTSLKDAVDIIERTRMDKDQSDPAAKQAERDFPPPAASERPVAPVSVGAAAPNPRAAPSRKLTFAERVRSGTFMPARGDASAATDRPKGVIPVPAAAAPAPAAPAAPAPAATAGPENVEAPQVRPTEPVDALEQLEPVLTEILEEVRMMRMRQPYSEFAVSKLLAGIVQVLVLPVLFFAYLHRDAIPDAQALLTLAAVLQTMTIALLIMGRQP
jgi:D-glycero-D-manno-heptose 1,7-bisphosphate phosphatase